jgi:hypothetical protein
MVTDAGFVRVEVLLDRLPACVGRAAVVVAGRGVG